MPNGITPIIPEIYYKVRTIYGRDCWSLNTNPYSYETLSTLVRRLPSTYLRTELGTSVRLPSLTYSRTELNHVTHLALVPWFDLFHLVDQFLQVLP